MSSPCHQPKCSYSLSKVFTKSMSSSCDQPKCSCSLIGVFTNFRSFTYHQPKCSYSLSKVFTYFLSVPYDQPKCFHLVFLQNYRLIFWAGMFFLLRFLLQHHAPESSLILFTSHTYSNTPIWRPGMIQLPLQTSKSLTSHTRTETKETRLLISSSPSTILFYSKLLT